MAANQAILDATIRHAVFLEQLKSGEVAKFAPFLKEIDRSIRERLTRADLTDYTIARLERLLSEVDSLLLGIFDRYSEKLNLDLVDIANYEAEFEATSLTRAAPVGVTFDAAVPGAAAIRAAILTNPLSVRGADGGKLLKSFIDGFTATERQRLTGAIRQGFFEGQTNFQIIKNIRGTKALQYNDGILATTNRNAGAIVRTAVQHVATQARMETLKENSDVVQSVEWVSTLDSKTTSQCRTLDKQRFKLTEGPRPPIHINCLPGYTLVSASSGIAGTSKRWFDGEVVVFKTASGRELTCTPNHPILTDKGWFSAQALNLGGKVVCDGSGKWAVGVDGYGDDVPSSIHQVTEAFLGHEGVLSVPVPVAAPDFHGDGVGSKVAVIGSDRMLGYGVYAALDQHRKDLALVSRNPALAGLVRNGALGFLLGTLRSASRGLVGALGKASSLFRRSRGHSSELLLTPVPHGNASQLEMPDDDIWCDLEMLCDSGDSSAFVEHFDSLINGDIYSGGAGNSHCDAAGSEGSVDHVTADAQLAAKILNGGSGAVFLDEIVDIRKQNFSGHVYNLETVEGWYFAAGIVTHNCRSTVVAVTRFSALFAKDATRASIGDAGAQQVRADLSYYDWLQQQPAAFQDKAIGPVRAKLFREGGLSIERFSELQLDRNFSPLTLVQMKALEPLAFERAGIK